MTSEQRRSRCPTRIRFSVSGVLAEAARECEAEVFWRRYGNSRAQLEDEYGPFLGRTGFVTVSWENGDVIGAARLILPSPAGFKTLADVAREPWCADPEEVVRLARIDTTRAIDVATLSVRQGSVLYAGTAVTLFHGIILAYRANGSRTTMAIIDTRVRSLLATLGYRYELLPHTWAAPYLGSA